MSQMQLTDEEVRVFDMYFAGVVSMNLHPGTTRDAARGWTMEECAEYALQMVMLRRDVIYGPDRGLRQPGQPGIE